MENRRVRGNFIPVVGIIKNIFTTNIFYFNCAHTLPHTSILSLVFSLNSFLKIFFT